MSISQKNRLSTLTAKKKLRVAGLISGTSADGVDAAVIEMDSQKVKLLAFDTFPYSAALRKKVFTLFQPESVPLDDICHYNVVLGEVFARALIQLCRKSKIKLETIDLIGSHGQTIYHNPSGRRFGSSKIGSTLQIGEPSVIAQRTGVTTVADFRPRDMAAGGQGAPLVPYADYILFRHPRFFRAVQNIGGIANVTYLPPGCQLHDILAFDTGPGNMVIDRMAWLASAGKKSFDKNGTMARRGTIHQRLLQEMLAHPFFRRRPPKSTGRELFGHQYADTMYQKARQKGISKGDVLATATTLTARTIAQAYRKFLPQMPAEIILCGGGARNDTLVHMLRQELNDVKILLMDDLKLNADAKEAVSFAILAYATLKGLPNNIPTATGAEHPVILGKIIPA